MVSNIAPQHRLRKNMNARRYEYPNCFVSDGVKAPMRPPTPPRPVKIIGSLCQIGGMTNGAAWWCVAVMAGELIGYFVSVAPAGIALVTLARSCAGTSSIEPRRLRCQART